METEYPDSRYDDWKEIDYEIKGNFINKEKMIEDWKNEIFSYLKCIHNYQIEKKKIKKLNDKLK